MGMLELVFKSKFSLKYYGTNDIATGWHITTLLDNENMFKEYLTLSDYQIESEDNLRDYLTLSTICEYHEIVSQLKNDSDKPRLKEIIDLSKETLNKYEQPLNQIYDLINKSYHSLLIKDNDDFNRHEFYDIVLDYIYKQHDRVKRDVFLFIENEHWGYIINNFNNCLSYYKQHTNELDNLLQKIFFEEEKHPYSNLIELFSNYKIHFFQEVFKKYVNILCDKALSLLKSMNEDNYINVYAYSEDIIKLAKQYDLRKRLSDFDRLKPIIDKNYSAYMKKHGKVFEQKIPIKEVIDKLRDELNSQRVASNITILGLTHTRLKKAFGYEASINTVFDLPKSIIMDSIRHIGLESNSIFTPSVQNQIRWMFGFHDHILGVIINDKDLSNVLYNVTSKVLEMICKEYSLDYLDLNNELNGIIDSIVYLFSIDDNYPYYRTFCFGLSQNICSYIEKILRKVFMEKYDKEVLYIPESQVTLGKLLDSEPIINIFGKRLTSIIRYELHFIEENENGVRKIIGMNLRNKLMHNNDIDYVNEIHMGLVTHLFHLLLTIIHQLETTIIKFDDE
ncbi:hypothetical protein N7603_01975 [Acholeplasma vituli]|uniref:DUF4209 domain-containing protein n=1 Tax=Paracholeplasma vituli TaxID=69473 RepID=A0ABT2PXJ1_9MOLU|nr:hypothetical protein [Paracholeplasma vituli]MCU0104422.1 hypothetical protein [Paracholeplasma vituli]